MKKKFISLITLGLLVMTMIPSFVFADAADVSVSASLPSAMETGEAKEFYVNTTAGDKAGTTVVLKTTVTGADMIDTLIMETVSDTWDDVIIEDNTFYIGSKDGFELADGSKGLDITFKKGGTFTLKFDLIDKATGDVLSTCTTSTTVKEFVKPTVTTDLPDTVKAGEVVEFTISTTKGDESAMVIGKSMFDGTAAIKSLQYFETADSTWKDLSLNADGEGTFGPASGFPLMDASSKFRVEFKSAGTFNLCVDIVELVDGAEGDYLASLYKVLTVTEADKDAGSTSTDNDGNKDTVDKDAADKAAADKKDTKNEKSPQTGDASNILIPGALAVIALAAMGVALHRKREEEK